MNRHQTHNHSGTGNGNTSGNNNGSRSGSGNGSSNSDSPNTTNVSSGSSSTVIRHLEQKQQQPYYHSPSPIPASSYTTTASSASTPASTPSSQTFSSPSQRRKLTKKPPSHYQHHSHHRQPQSQAAQSRSPSQQSQKHSQSYPITSDGRSDAPSLLQGKRSSSSLKRAPSAPLQNQGTYTTASISSNASNNSSPRHPPVSLPFSSNKITRTSPVLQPAEFLPSTFSPSNPRSDSRQLAAPAPASHSHIQSHSPTHAKSHISPLSPPPTATTTTTTTIPTPTTITPARPAANPSGNIPAAPGVVGIGVGAGTTSSASTRSNNYTHHLRLSGSQQLPLRPFRSKSSEEDFVGAPFDSNTILSQLDRAANQVPAVHSAALRTAHPPPPPLSSPSADPRVMSPVLRRSASFSAANATMSEKANPTRVNDAAIAPKRYSDESREPKGPGVLRKKSGFSGLMSTLVGSQKKPVISAPENPVHVTHVGYDSNTGQFTVRLSLVLSCLALSFFLFFFGSRLLPIVHRYGDVRPTCKQACLC